MKGYLEYLELHGYFGGGEPRLTRAQYDAADAEYRALAVRHRELAGDEKARLGELKAMLLRDKP